MKSAIIETGYCVSQTINGKKSSVQAPNLALSPLGFSIAEARKIVKSTVANVKALGLTFQTSTDFVCFISAGGDLVYLQVCSV